VAKKAIKIIALSRRPDAAKTAVQRIYAMLANSPRNYATATRPEEWADREKIAGNGRHLSISVNP
jgi:hypothetical protein